MMEILGSDEKFSRLVNALHMVTENLRLKDSDWFLSFGTLLWFIRDLPRGLPLAGDFDISMGFGRISIENLRHAFEDFGYVLRKAIIPDNSPFPLQVTFRATSLLYPNIDIDIWFWVPYRDYYWHCGDFDNVAALGTHTLPGYTLKGIPSKWIDGKSNIFETLPNEAILSDIAPPMNLPKYYGTLLDYWYPAMKPGGCWFNKVHNYGQSKCEKQLSIKSFSEIKL
jgi:hypothetical protein